MNIEPGLFDMPGSFVEITREVLAVHE